MSEKSHKRLRKQIKRLLNEGWVPADTNVPITKTGRRALHLASGVDNPVTCFVSKQFHMKDEGHKCIPPVDYSNPKERQKHNEWKSKQSFGVGERWRRPYGTAGLQRSRGQSSVGYERAVEGQGREVSGEDGMAQHHGLGEASGNRPELREEGQQDSGRGTPSDG